jgi:hypothetical protein
MADLTVTFGANIADLSSGMQAAAAAVTEGVSSINQQFQSLAQSGTDAVNQVASSLGQLVSVIGSSTNLSVAALGGAIGGTFLKNAIDPSLKFIALIRKRDRLFRLAEETRTRADEIRDLARNSPSRCSLQAFQCVKPPVCLMTAVDPQRSFAPACSNAGLPHSGPCPRVAQTAV